jgi:hypothetical protein
MKKIAVILIVTFAAPLAAQTPVDIGARVRIATQDRKFTGTLIASDPASVRIDKGGKLGFAVIPRELIRKVEASHGQDRDKSTRLGALVGIGIAAGLSYLAPISPFGSGRILPSERRRIFFGWSILVVPVTTAIGFKHPFDRWRAASLR